eukprot:m.372275 g.372275  ORF g.372275 m.372275 type:complete len:66 (-) comp62605_c0_seq1:224-421(-)
MLSTKRNGFSLKPLILVPEYQQQPSISCCATWRIFVRSTFFSHLGFSFIKTKTKKKREKLLTPVL